jgi:hypothetical protein
MEWKISWNNKIRGYRRKNTKALSLAKECYFMKLDLLTNASVVEYSIRFASHHNQSEGEVYFC